jgi:hypothetical protein
MPSFFEGLVPEGWLLDVIRRNWKVSPNDKMALLLIAGKDCPGAAGVVDPSSPDTELTSIETSSLTEKILEQTNAIGRCHMCGCSCNHSQLYHGECAALLFDSETPQLPLIDGNAIEDIACMNVVQKRILTGVQKKLSPGLTMVGDKKRITLFGQGQLADYILKPESNEYDASLARNEHATMLLAKFMGFRVPSFALMPLANGELAYICECPS